MKKGWEIKTLGEICEVLDSKRKPITKRDRTAGEYPYYGATGILDYVHEYIFDEQLVLIGEDGAKWESGEWTAFIAEGKYWVNNHAHVIRPNRKIVLDNWIVYFLCFSDLHKYVTGLTVPKLNQERLRSITLPIPPLPEQQRIVSVLDEAFASIAQAKSNAERNLVNARELFETVLENVFSNSDFINSTLGDAAEIISGYGFSSRDFSPNNSIKSIKITNVGVKEFVEESDNFLPSSFQSEYKKVLVKEADIVIALTRSVIANGLKVAIVPKSYDKSLLNQRVAALRAKKDIVLNSFLYLFLCSERVADYVRRQANTLMQPNLSITDLHNLPIPLPPLAEQRAIVWRLEALSAETGLLEEIYQQKVESLEELKKSVLGKAFEGEL
jgi:type I restriction enzyme S subunit